MIFLCKTPYLHKKKSNGMKQEKRREKIECDLFSSFIITSRVHVWHARVKKKLNTVSTAPIPCSCYIPTHMKKNAQ